MARRGGKGTTTVLTVKLDDKFTPGIGKATKGVDKLGKTGKTAFKSMSIGAKASLAAIKGLSLGIITLNQGIQLVGSAARGLKALAAPIININMEMEKFKARLTAMKGSEEAADKALQQLIKTAKALPFTTTAVVEAGISIEAFGGDMQKLTPILADLAVFMGEDITAAADAMGRALAGGAGAADIFRDRGILQIIKASSGIEDLTKLTLPEFEAAMIQAFTDPDGKIAGGAKLMEKTAEGLGSAFLTLKDEFLIKMTDELWPKFLEAGTQALAKLDELFDTGKAEELANVIEQSLIGAMNKVPGAVDLGIRAISQMVAGLEGAASAIYALQTGFIQLQIAFNAALQLVKTGESDAQLKTEMGGLVAARDASAQKSIEFARSGARHIEQGRETGKKAKEVLTEVLAPAVKEEIEESPGKKESGHGNTIEVDGKLYTMDEYLRQIIEESPGKKESGHGNTIEVDGKLYTMDEYLRQIPTLSSGRYPKGGSKTDDHLAMIRGDEWVVPPEKFSSAGLAMLKKSLPGHRFGMDPRQRIGSRGGRQETSELEAVLKAGDTGAATGGKVGLTDQLWAGALGGRPLGLDPAWFRFERMKWRRHAEKQSSRNKWKRSSRRDSPSRSGGGGGSLGTAVNNITVNGAFGNTRDLGDGLSRMMSASGGRSGGASKSISSRSGLVMRAGGSSG